MIAKMKCIYDRMVCKNLIITAWSFLHTAEQMKGKKSATGFKFLILLSQHNTECSAMYLMVGKPKVLISRIHKE